MPLYEYACATCGHRFEVRQGIREASLTICPECEGAIRRVVHPVGIVFKGSGFYKTDSRTTSEASVPAAERKAETPGGADSSSANGTTGTAAPAASSPPATAPASAPAASTPGS